MYCNRFIGNIKLTLPVPNTPCGVMEMISLLVTCVFVLFSLIDGVEYSSNHHHSLENPLGNRKTSTRA
ncbi:hypothetical protein E2C01_031719 [Portunus trituberculatus]|uniref:Uncharacterized protein n=1 Tax=Portunus trituberculatus TaxID=210409 RepID=A0A5B7F0U3_PORTR|nr:hypothetical protein [Portunus trituberculatus]